MGQLTETEILPSGAQGSLSRADARLLNLKHYTGAPCKRGHVGLRFVSDASCVQCKTEQAVGWAAANADRRRDLGRSHYAANAPVLRARQRGYRAANPEQKAETRANWDAANPGYTKSWYQDNAEDQRAKRRARWAAKPDVYTAHGRNRRARERGAEGTHTASDIADIRRMQADRCAYCRVDLGGKGHADHIQPLALGGSNWPRNIQLLCEPCNCAKNASDPVDYARKTGRLV